MGIFRSFVDSDEHGRLCFEIEDDHIEDFHHMLICNSDKVDINFGDLSPVDQRQIYDICRDRLHELLLSRTNSIMEAAYAHWKRSK